MIRVYQYGLRPPVEGERVVREIMRHAHDYRNDLVAIERGRRAAVRAALDTDAVREAEALVRSSSRSTRADAIKRLAAARRDAKIAAKDELDRIASLDASIRRDARALSPLSPRAWGTYEVIDAAADQMRRMPLYEPDGITPADPRFVRGPRLGREAFRDDDPRSVWWLGDGQVGMRVQGRTATTEEVLAGRDAWVRIVLEPDRFGREGYPRYGTLWLRVASAGPRGMEPVWGKWPIKMHRALPTGARIKCVRVSCRREAMRERWTVEITIDDPAPRARDLDTSLDGAIAVALAWTPLKDGSIRVASWLDSRGGFGQVIVPARIVAGIRKPDGIRSVRDRLLNELRATLATALRECSEPLPPWLREAAATMHLWRSSDRFRALAMRWRRERCDAARSAYELLDAWEEREAHLYDYETGARGEALRERREMYRVLAAQWSRLYRTILLPDRDLSREARWGDDSEWRVTAAPQELRGALRHAFGKEAVEVEWRGPHGVIDDGDEDREPPTWLEMAIERWRGMQITRFARDAGKDNVSEQNRGGAWARRKRAKAERERAQAAARDVGGKVAE